MTKNCGPGISGFVRMVEAERIGWWRSKARSAGLTIEESEKAERYAIEQAKALGCTVADMLDFTLAAIMVGRKPGSERGSDE